MQSARTNNQQLTLLEAFVCEKIANLPRIDRVIREKKPHELCVNYQTACSDILREVLNHVGVYSTRLSFMLGQIWDVSSMNVLVLIKLYEKQIKYTQEYTHELTHANKMAENIESSTTVTINQLERAAEENKILIRELKAENYSIRMQNKRLENENAHTFKILESVLSQNKGEKTLDDESDEEDEFLVNSKEDIERYRMIDPFDTACTDLSVILSSMSEDNKVLLERISEMDRFINSNLVSVLWRHQPNRKTAFLQKLVAHTSSSTQTEAFAPMADILTVDFNAHTLETLNKTERFASIHALDIQEKLKVNKVNRVLPKDTLVDMILQFLVEKIDVDAISIKAQKPRLPLGAFLQKWFQQKYGLLSLGNGHLVDVFKSCQYYFKQLPDAKTKLLSDPSGASLNWDDARILLFGRLSDIIDMKNTPICVIQYGANAIVDVLGDLLEVDSDVSSLDDVLNVSKPILLCRTATETVLAGHFEYLDNENRQKVADIFRGAPTTTIGSTVKVDLDWILSTFLRMWMIAQTSMTERTRQAFKAILCHRATCEIEMGPDLKLTMTEFIQAVSFLDDMLEERAISELFWTIIEKTKAANLGKAKIQSKLQNGIGENDFVTHVTNFFRTQRSQVGIRTHGKPICDISTGTYIGGKGLIHINGMPVEVKPGLSRRRSVLASTCIGSSN